MWRPLLPVLLACCCVAQAAPPIYCNQRFAFCVTPPDWLYGQGESDAGDGQTFLSRDGRVTLAVWGNWSDMPDYQTAFREASRGWAASGKQPARVVTYKLFKPGFFVVSGIKSSQVF